MINLKYKGIYKNENQLLNGVLNKENISTIIIISSLISVLTLFIHEILHALAFPFKSVKELWIKPNEMAAFIYCNTPLKNLNLFGCVYALMLF